VPIVYRAASIIDAQLVVDELSAAGMKARISGTYLSGAVGELPPDQVVSVWVDIEQHVDRARQVIVEFEAEQRSSGPEQACERCAELLSPQFGRCWNCGALQPIQDN